MSTVTFRMSVMVFAYSQPVRRGMYAAPDASGAFTHCGEIAPPVAPTTAPGGADDPPPVEPEPDPGSEEIEPVQPKTAASSTGPKRQAVVTRDCICTRAEFEVVGIARCMVRWQ